MRREIRRRNCPLGEENDSSTPKKDRLPRSMITPDKCESFNNSHIKQYYTADDIESVASSDTGSEWDSTQSLPYKDFDNRDEMDANDDDIDEEEQCLGTSHIKQGINRLINFKAVKSMVEDRCCCCVCKGPIELTELTVGIGTTFILTCVNCPEATRQLNLLSRQ